VNREVLGPTLQTLQGLGVSYQGVLFCGLILDAENKLWVLEYNARFGDPETQAILPRIEEPLFPILKAASSERGFSGLSGFQNARTLKTSSETSLAVVMASQGYPSSAMRVGEDLTLGSSRGATTEIFYAGVKMGAHGRLQNHSGRVLTIQGKAHDLEQVRLKVYRELASRVRFPGMHYRRDIGSFANPPKLRLGILASGRGSNAQVVMEACRKGELPAEVALLVSSREKAQVLERAQALQVPTMVCQDAGLGLHEVLAQAAPIDFILCLGYMKILKPEFLDLWLDSEGQSRILNLHPSLLPKFPGAKAYEEIHQAREPESGATLHRVTSDLDQGPKIAQSSYLVDPEWSLEDLKKRGLEFEHRFLLESLKKLWLSPFRGVQKGKVPSVVSN
jgi:phosphoribosylglycinamide formyltransferase-1